MDSDAFGAVEAIHFKGTISGIERIFAIVHSMMWKRFVKNATTKYMRTKRLDNETELFE